MEQVGLRKLFAQQAEAGDDGCHAPLLERIRLDDQHVYLEQVARHGTLHEYGPSERMIRQEAHSSDVGRRGLRPELAVEAVAQVRHHDVPGFDLQHRRDRLVPAVMSGAGLLVESLERVDRYGVFLRHAKSPPRVPPGAALDGALPWE